MKAKLGAILYIIIIVIIIMISIGHIYKEQCSKLKIHKQEEQKISNEKDGIVENEANVDDEQTIIFISLGEFKLTAYCPCEICCGIWANNRPNGIVYGAIGEELKEHYSIAVDPNVIPYGTEVIINGNVYKAQDCGGAIKGNRIDIYFEDHNEALEFGVQYAEIFLNL